MTMRKPFWRELAWQASAALALASATLLASSGCNNPSDAAKADAVKSSNSADLFTIPQDQMSHIQVLTVEPTTLTRFLRLTGTVAYNGFRTTP